jgi:hypothetical protein
MKNLNAVRYTGLALVLSGCAGHKAERRYAELEPAPYYLTAAQAAAIKAPPPPAPAAAK